jgi:Tfp pilus assembly protein PilF
MPVPASTLHGATKLTPKGEEFADHISAANSARAAGDNATLESELRAALELFPAEATVRYQLVTLLTESGRRAEAADELQIILYPQPGTGSSYQSDPVAWLQYSVLRSEENEKAATEEALAKVLSLTPASLGRSMPKLDLSRADDAGKWSNAYMASAFRHFSHGRMPQAANDALKAVESDKSSAVAHFYYGVILRYASDLPRAAQELQTAKDLAPDDTSLNKEADRIMRDVRNKLEAMSKKST